MIIKTSSWFMKLPAQHVRIGISRGVPRNLPHSYNKYPLLNPGPWFNRCASPDEFKDRYFEILAQLDPSSVANDLQRIAGEGNVAVIVCWEPPPPDGGWCHRALVSAWLHDELELVVPEVGHEHLGYGWQHPKLDRSLMRKKA